MNDIQSASWHHSITDDVLMIRPSKEVSADGFEQWPYLCEPNAVKEGELFPHRGVIVDLSEATFMPSACIGMLMLMHRVCGHHHVPFVVCGLQDSLSNNLRIIGVDRVLMIKPGVEQAMAYIIDLEASSDD